MYSSHYICSKTHLTFYVLTGILKEWKYIKNKEHLVSDMLAGCFCVQESEVKSWGRD